MASIPWPIYEKVFAGPLRKTIFLYLYMNGSKHVYGIAKDLYEMGLTKNIRSVIETINKMRKYGVFKENVKIIGKNRRVVEIDIDWEKMINSLLEYIENNVKLNMEECEKLKKMLYKDLIENKIPIKINVKKYKSNLRRIGKMSLFDLIKIIILLREGPEAEELFNRISTFIFDFLVSFPNFK